MKLRNMQAEYYELNNVTVVFNEKHTEHLNKAIVFQSYKSVCAIYNPDALIIYLMPRWDYSVTTLRQLRAFIDDVTQAEQFDISELRKYESQFTDNALYLIVEGFIPEHSTKVHTW